MRNSLEKTKSIVWELVSGIFTIIYIVMLTVLCIGSRNDSFTTSIFHQSSSHLDSSSTSKIVPPKPKVNTSFIVHVHVHLAKNESYNTR